MSVMCVVFVECVMQAITLETQAYSAETSLLLTWVNRTSVVGQIHQLESSMDVHTLDASVQNLEASGRLCPLHRSC